VCDVELLGERSCVDSNFVKHWFRAEEHYVSAISAAFTNHACGSSEMCECMIEIDYMDILPFTVYIVNHTFI
jgi:hypothetical protein